jgi:SAM-dependent methyltransferase
MFNKSAAIYDAIFSAKGKNWEQEAREFADLVKRYKRSGGKALLSVACGTGGHEQYLQREFEVTGLDIDPEMLAIARERLPKLEFHCASMVDFSIPKQFDIVMCLFSAIGYANTSEKLHRAILTMTNHLVPGGILIVEPWLAPGEFRPGAVFSTFVDQPDLKVARMNTNVVRGNTSVIEFHYLVGTPQGVEHFTELHELALFKPEEYRAAFDAAGVETHFEPKGLIGRGVYVGIRGK